MDLIEASGATVAMSDPKLVGVFGATDEKERGRIRRRRYRRPAA